MSLHAAIAGAAEIHAKITDQGGKPVEDAVVIARSLAQPEPPLPAKKEDNLVDQIDKDFVPYVKPVLVGSLVRFPNKDNVRHNVYSFSPAKKFELPLYSGTAAPPVLFDKPGVVALGCNIHDWMVGYIYVAETPNFGKSAKEGRVTFKELPAGSYAVRVWHPRMKESEESTVRRMVVTESGADVEWQLNLNPDTRVRRAPAKGAATYR
jgi:plastocyanin